MLSPNRQEKVQWVSQYADIKPQKSILAQILGHIPGSFPQPVAQLQSNLNNVPGYLMNGTLYKQIHAYNRQMMLKQFEYFCQIVMQAYSHTYSHNHSQLNTQQFVSRVCQVFVNQIKNGKYYANSITRDKISTSNKAVTAQHIIQYLRALMMRMGLAYNQFYGYSRPQNGDKLSQKYVSIIQDKLNTITKPISTSLIEEILINSMSLNSSQQMGKTQSQIQAENIANSMNQVLHQKYYNATHGTTPNNHNNSNNNNNYYNSNRDGIQNPLNFIPFAITYGQQNSTNSMANQRKSNNIMSRIRQSISNQMNSNANTNTNTNRNRNQMQLYDRNKEENSNSNSNRMGYDKYNKSSSVDFENWFNNTLSQMTYYESYMMAHMADLMFLHPELFKIHLIKYDPYLQQLQKHITQQLNDIKSEETAFKMVFNSQLHRLQSHPQPYHPNTPIYSRVQDIPLQPIKYQDNTQNIAQKIKQVSPKEKGAFDKAKDKIFSLYDKVKSKNSDPTQSLNTSITNYQSQYQDIKIPISPVVAQNTYNYIVQDIQNLNGYLSQLRDQNPFGNSLTQKIWNMAQKIKDKVTHNQQHYYHQIQSWMVVVMLLYKALAFNYANNYEYTPFRRRTIIKICKRIFIDEKNKNNSINDKQSMPFKNWPVVLKFLQNNRPEIATAPLCSVVEEDVNKIIQHIYKSIINRQLAGSTYDNLFYGIKNINENLPQIKFVCLSSGSNPTQNLNKNKSATQCKVVHILISGFLSQDTDKVGEWSELVDKMPDSEIYALIWESNTIKNLVKFFLKSTVAIIGAKKMIDELRKKYTDNPFNPAFEVAQITGRILAQIVMRLFPNRFVNVFGYSLGSEVIKQYMRRMIQKNQSHIINNVYIMGGVSDVHLCEQIIAQSPTPLCVYNSYTNHDTVLRQLLSLCKPDVAPVGLVPFKKIQGHTVINVDCTKFISGHLAFRSNLSLMGQILQIFIG